MMEGNHHDEAGESQCQSADQRAAQTERLDYWLANEGPAWLRYGVAILGVALALLLDESDFLSGGFRIYLVFYPFIVIATLFGGLGPGLLAIALSCLAASFIWLEPVGRFAIASRADRVSMGVFIAGNLFFVGICEWLRRAIHRAALVEAQRKSAAELARQAQLVLEHERQLKEALRMSEERLSFALQTAQIGAWELDLLNHTANREWIHDRIFGYETLLPNWTYEMFLEHVLPEDRPDVDRKFHEAIAKQSSWNFECRIRRVDGEVRWIWAAGGHERDADGKLVRMAGIVQDITERKQGEEALRKSEQQLRRFIEGIPVGYIQWKMDARWSQQSMPGMDALNEKLAPAIDRMTRAYEKGTEATMLEPFGKL